MESRTYSDRAESIKRAVKKRRLVLRNKAVIYKGGKCVACGYSRCIPALDFHHIADKHFGISGKGYSQSWENIKKELDKCILLCANCHRELHAGLLQLSREILA